MADTETSSVTISAHPGPADEPIRKEVDEQTQDTTQMGIPPSKDDEAKGDIEKRRLETSAGTETAATNMEESSPVVIEDINPDKIAPSEAKSNGVETPVTEPEASATQETNDGPQGTQVGEKSIDAIESIIKEEPTTDGIKNESGEQAAEKPLDAAALEKKPDEVEAIVKKPEENSEVEVIEKAPEEKPAVEEVKEAVEVKPAVEEVKIVAEEKPVGQLQSVKDKEAGDATESVILTKENPKVELGEKEHEEKTVVEEVCNASEEKSASEEVGKSIVEETPKIDPEEKPTVEVKTIHDDSSPKAATESVTQYKQEVEVSIHKPEEKAAVETLAEEKPAGNEAAAIETVETKQEDKQEDQSHVDDKVVPTTEVQNAENVQMKNEEKVPETKLNLTTEPPAPIEEAQADNKAAKDPSVSEAEKAVKGDDNEEPVKEEINVTEKIEEKKAKDDIIEEDKEKKSFKLGELMQEETNETELANSADHADNSSKVAEKTVEEEQASKDIEVVKEKDDNIIEDAPISVETNKEKDVSNAEATNDKPAEVEHKNNGQLEVKAEDKAESDGMEAAKESDELKSDENNSNRAQESSKDVDNGKEAQQDLATQGKAAPKQSSNIISKVKQSIVKVKKAIVKKSPSSKTLSPEAKSDGKAK